MALENRAAQQQSVVDKFVNIIAAYHMRSYDYVVRATANTATDSYTVYLPPVADAKGRFYSIVASIANSKTITVTHHSDSESWTANASLTVTGHKVLAYSDGMTWHIIKVTA